MERDSNDRMPQSVQEHPRAAIVSPERDLDLLTDESENEEMLVKTVRGPKVICGKYTVHHIVVFILTFWG